MNKDFEIDARLASEVIAELNQIYNSDIDEFLQDLNRKKIHWGKLNQKYTSELGWEAFPISRLDNKRDILLQLREILMNEYCNECDIAKSMQQQCMQNCESVIDAAFDYEDCLKQCKLTCSKLLNLEVNTQNIDNAINCLLSAKQNARATAELVRAKWYIDQELHRIIDK